MAYILATLYIYKSALITLTELVCKHLSDYIYLSLFVQKTQKHNVTITYSVKQSGTAKWDHDGSEHCRKMTKKNNRLRPDEKWTIRKLNKKRLKIAPGTIRNLANFAKQSQCRIRIQ